MRNRSDSYRTQIQSALLKLLLCWNFRIRNRWGCCHVVTGPDVAPIQVVYAVYLPTSGLFIWQFSNFLPKMPWWSSDCNAENSRKLFRLFFFSRKPVFKNRLFFLSHEFVEFSHDPTRSSRALDISPTGPFGAANCRCSGFGQNIFLSRANFWCGISLRCNNRRDPKTTGNTMTCSL